MTDQERAFEKLSRLKVGALFMSMGTGKTKVALDLMASRAGKGVGYFLWICPFSTIGEIERERRKWHPELDLEIVGAETLSASGRRFLELLDRVSKARSFVTVDESLKIKNPDALRTRRIMELGRKAEYRLILNGTPMSRNLMDLWTQMEFLSPRILGMDERTFKDTFCIYPTCGKAKGAVVGQANIPYLVSLIEPYVFDCDLDLDVGKSYDREEYRIDDREGYEAVKEGFIRSCLDLSRRADFYRISTMLQLFYTKSPSRAAILRRILGEREQKIVFVRFVSNIPEGEEAIVGSTGWKAREETLRRFRDGRTRNLFMTYGTGSFGLNLQNCRRVVFADHCFDYAQRKQAEARIFRKGQEHDVRYTDLVCLCGLERMILDCLSRKSDLLGEVKMELETRTGEEVIRSL